jgi:hypothetical protein
MRMAYDSQHFILNGFDRKALHFSCILSLAVGSGFSPKWIWFEMPPSQMRSGFYEIDAYIYANCGQAKMEEVERRTA